LKQKHRAHDAGVMAGMRASLSNMLLSLDPRNADTALHTLPDAALHVAVASDKARWWDTQNNRYARVLADAEDNFEDAWGRVFVEAYSGAADRVRSDAARAALTVKPKEIEESCPTS
jgi:FHA domain-containing protein